MEGVALCIAGQKLEEVTHSLLPAVRGQFNCRVQLGGGTCTCIPELSSHSHSRSQKEPIPIPDEFRFPCLHGSSPALQGAPATDGVGVVHTLAAAAQLSTHVHWVTEQLQRMRDHCTCRFLGR